MDSLQNKPMYTYNETENSKIYYNNISNCCLISSFQIQMKKHYVDFPSLDFLLEKLYPNTKNAFTHFAYEFPLKWCEMKKLLILQNPIWKDKLDKIVLRFFVGTHKKDTCVLISCIDINKINHQEVSNGKFDTLENALSDEVPKDKITVDILQKNNHFEPINIIKQIPKVKCKIDIDEAFF